MIDEKTLQLKVESMERAAEDALRCNAAFSEALNALKSEIDLDPQVRSAVISLQTSGKRVVGTVVPHVKIRIKTSKGQVALPSQRQVSVTPAPAKVAQSALELKHSTIAVIMRSRYREELDAIVNEALANSLFFEQLASDIENAGHEVVICLDLSLCEEVENSSKTFSGPIEKSSIARSLNPLARLLSDRDLDFLKSMKIKVSAS